MGSSYSLSRADDRGRPGAGASPTRLSVQGVGLNRCPGCQAHGIFPANAHSKWKERPGRHRTHKAMTQRAVLLLAHGSRDAEARAEYVRIHEALADRLVGRTVVFSVLEFPD